MIRPTEPSEEQTENPLQVADSQRVPGGLFGIDQEVVTLRGLSRQLPGQGFKAQDRSPKDESLRATDAMPASVITG